MVGGQIQDHHIRLKDADLFHRLLTVTGLAHDLNWILRAPGWTPAQGGEQRFQTLPDPWLVVGDQQAHRGHTLL